MGFSQLSGYLIRRFALLPHFMHRTLKSCSDYVVEEDFMKAARKIGESKKLESGSKDFSKM
jgi:hypothetical protein